MLVQRSQYNIQERSFDQVSKDERQKIGKKDNFAIAAGMVGPIDPTIGQLRFYIKYWENWNANSEVAFRELK